MPSGERVPALGQGTWHMGESRRRAAEEAAALRARHRSRHDPDRHRRDVRQRRRRGDRRRGRRRAGATRLFIVSKVLPYNASQQGVVEACERSLKRLKTDRIDLYLLHWRGSVPFAETLAASSGCSATARSATTASAISTADDMEEWVGAGRRRDRRRRTRSSTISRRRGPEWDLIPWCRERNIAIMAYSPLEPGPHARPPGAGRDRPRGTARRRRRSRSPGCCGRTA